VLRMIPLPAHSHLRLDLVVISLSNGFMMPRLEAVTDFGMEVVTVTRIDLTLKNSARQHVSALLELPNVIFQSQLELAVHPQ